MKLKRLKVLLPALTGMLLTNGTFAISSNQQNEFNNQILKSLNIQFKKRINDLPERAIMATFKLSVYAYENDLELGGDSYQILVNEDKETKKVILDLLV